MNQELGLTWTMAAALCWALTCLHLVLAYRSSPDASVFRPFWKNRHTKRGRRHLFIAALWIVVGTVVFSLST